MNLLDRIRTSAAMAIAPKYDRKASIVGSLLRMFTIGNAVWTPKRYDKLAEVAFQCNVIGYKAVSMISRSFAGIPIGLYDENDDEVEKHPVLQLLNKPNPWQSGKKFRECWCAFYSLAGNAYVEGADASIDGSEEESDSMKIPVELYTHRPDRMVVKLSSIGTPDQYIYKAQGGERKFNVDPIDGTGPMLHVKTFHPLNDFYGMSPIEAAGWSIDQHNESSQWNKSLLQNGARPSGAMTWKPNGVVGASLTDDQYRLLRQQLDERMSGPENASKPLILDGGMEWTEMGLSPKDMDWLKGRDGAAREIAMAFGVPAQMLGIPGDNTYSNMEEARASFYEETVIPLGESLLEALSNWLLPAFGLPNHQLKLELDDVSALFIRRKAKWDMISATDCLTVNEKRRELRYDPLPTPLADELLVKTGMTPLDDLGATDQQIGPDGQVIPAKPSFSEDRQGVEGDPADPTEEDATKETVGALKKAVDRLGNGWMVKRRK